MDRAKTRFGDNDYWKSKLLSDIQSLDNEIKLKGLSQTAGIDYSTIKDNFVNPKNPVQDLL